MSGLHPSGSETLVYSPRRGTVESPLAVTLTSRSGTVWSDQLPPLTFLFLP